MKLRALVVGCALLGACEKAGEHSSATLSPEDMSLLRDLPGGNSALLGGNYMKLQGFMDTALGKLTERVMSRGTGADPAAFKAWSDCFASIPQIRMAGGVTFEPTVGLRFVFRGMTIKDVSSCAEKASYQASVDPDGRFIAVEVPGPGGQVMHAGYMALADGTILLDQQVKLGRTPSFEPGTRVRLEEIAGKLASSNAAGDSHLIELAAKTDRTKTFWFAGTGAHTPFASKLGDVYGSFDTQNGGMAMDAAIELTDPAVAAKLDEGFTQAKKNADHLPPAFKTIVDSITLQRTGGTVHVAASLTADQISSFASLAGVQ